MAKLTASEVAVKVNKSVYTVKRWYKWYESLTFEQLQEFLSKGMPELPKYETIGNTNWRYWDETDVEQIIKFRDWVPNTRGGYMGKIK